MSDRLAATASLAMIANVLLFPYAARGQPAADLSLSSLAATCAGCHGTAGRAVRGGAIPSLAGMPRETFIADMLGFRDGTRPDTIMQQLAKGFDEARIEALAGYFAARGAEPPGRPANTAR